MEHEHQELPKVDRVFATTPEPIGKGLLTPKVLGTIVMLGSPTMLIEFLLKRAVGLPEARLAGLQARWRSST